MADISTPLVYTVRRCAPELIVPAKPTPRELKPLSDIDDQERLQRQIVDIIVYRSDPKMRNKNPASMIREALAKLLVFYYPFAGRLKKGTAGKLMVDCSGEGVLFIEAQADVTLNQFGDALHPPFPCMDELLYNVPGTDGILDSPLLLIQVTLLLCGGFIFAVRLNHAMSDAAGLVQFLSGLGEIAQGATSPSILPVWQRELLLCSGDRSQTPITLHGKPQVTCTKIRVDDIVHKSLFFTTKDISSLRRLVPIRLQRCTTFEVLTACIWRCRTIALKPDPGEDMPVILVVNARKMFNPPLPVGYYGNVLTFPAALSTARDLCNKPLGYALELVMKAKSDVSKQYIRSVSDVMALKGRLYFENSRAYLISDLRRGGFDVVDLGWGKAAYGGVAYGGVSVVPHVTSFYVPYTNIKGEAGIVVPIYMPSGVVGRFVKEVTSLLAQGKNDEVLMEDKLRACSKL